MGTTTDNRFVRLMHGGARPLHTGTEPLRIPCDVVVVAVGQGIGSRHFEDSGLPVKKGAIDALVESSLKDMPGIFPGETV